MCLMIQKAVARKKALLQSTTLDAETKQKLQPLMKPQYMSSDESVVESGDDSEQEEQLGEKKLVKRRAVWRSHEFQNYIDSIDHKIQRRRSDRGRSMTLKVEIGENSARSAPEDCPEWACIDI